MTATFYAFRSPLARSRKKATIVEQAPGKFDNFVSVIPYGGKSRSKASFELKYNQSVLQSLYDDEIPDLILDLVEIAVLTYAVDKYVKREIDIQGDDKQDLVNTRNIKLYIPVLSPKLADEDVEVLFSEIVSHTTRDLFELEFVQWEVEDPIGPRSTSGDGPDAVSLLSDGLDSTAGIFYNSEANVDSHYATVNYEGITPTVDKISDSTGIESTIFGIGKTGQGNEFTQLSRGVLHLTFGVATAVGVGAETVQSFENGIAARFSILGDGWTTTRTVSPYLLRRYNTLLDYLLDDPVRVTNPFTHETKTEIATLVPDTDLVESTVSCPHKGKYNGFDENNCNLCVPCVLRTTALLNSDHDIDLDRTGVFDSFTAADFTEMTFPEESSVLQTYDELRQKRGLKESANSPRVFLDAMVEIAYFARLMLEAERDVVLTQYTGLYSEPVFELHERFAENFVRALKNIESDNQTVSSLLPDRDLAVVS